MIWCSAHSTRIYIHDRDIKSQHETKLHLFASEQALLNLNADLISSESGMAGGVDQRTGAPLAPALHCRSAPAPIRNRKRPVADSGTVRNTMGRRVSTPPRRGAGPLARTANVCIFSYQKTRQRVTRPHVPPAAERALQVRWELRPALSGGATGMPAMPRHILFSRCNSKYIYVYLIKKKKKTHP